MIETKFNTNEKKDGSILIGDSTAQLGRIEENFSQAANKARADVKTWAEDGLSQLNKKFGDITEDAKVTLFDTADTVSQDVGHQLRRFNTKVQQAANKIPGGLGKKAARYPWITVTIGLFLGMLLGFLLKRPRTA